MTQLTALLIRGRVPPGREQFYQTVPFDIPDGIERIDVEYSYSDAIGSDPHLTGGNTVDIGLFDWRGDEFLNAGFRGWSGSARTGFFVSTRDATPGYLPGPLTAGMWFIALGFYKIGPRGCDYDIRVTFTPGPDAADTFPPMLRLDSPNAAIPAREDGWYRGELHCHTVHSDGDSTAREVVAAAEALGLDFLAIMDHNNITHLVELEALGPQKLILIPGYEVTTYKGHWNLWSPPEWIDFRVQSPDDMETAIRRAADGGGLPSCNHPRPYGPLWEYEHVGGYSCVEVWNGPWWLANADSLAFWEQRLHAGQHLTAIGGSDMHRLKGEHQAKLGTPTTWIHCPGTPTAAGLLDGIRAGHVMLSERPDGPRLFLKAGDAMMGDTIPRPETGKLALQVRVVGGSGARLELHGVSGLLFDALIDGEDISIEANVSIGESPYIRAQLVDPSNDMLTVRALTNPIYLGKPSPT